MTEKKTTNDTPKGELILYQTVDGRTRIECRFEGETVWLTQAMLAELFDIGVGTVNHHLKEIFAEGELAPEATIRQYRIVRIEGQRSVAREIEHYNLEAILAVGFRVRSQRGTQFRKWANARLSEYLVKGFTMDDERLKNPPGPGHTDYFDELLERIREIRASERRFYQKVLDIYATSIDYQPDTKLSQQFFATPGACPVPEGHALRPDRQAQRRNDGQVVRGAPCFVRANSDDLAQCPGLVHPNAVERKDWQTRRKASHGGTTAETPVKPAQRPPPKKPFIDVAQKNGRHARNASEQCK